MVGRIRVLAMLVVLLVMSAWASAALVPVPAKDSSGFFLYKLGYSQGEIYLLTGNTIYKLGDDGLGNQQFDPWVGGLQSAWGGPTRAIEGAFGISEAGTALVGAGFSDRGVLMVDLVGQSVQVVPDFDGDAPDNDNVFEAAGRADGTYVAVASPSFLVSTLLYRVDGTTLAATNLGEAAPGQFSGGMAFDAAGNLLIGTFLPTGIFPDPTGIASFFQINAADVDTASPTVHFLGSGTTNGNGSMVIDMLGDIYFNTTTGIGRFSRSIFDVYNVYGDINDPNAYGVGGPPAVTLEGLAYDPTTNSLYFAQRDEGSGDYFLQSLALESNSANGVPEPAALGLAVMGLATLVGRGRRERGR